MPKKLSVLMILGLLTFVSIQVLAQATETFEGTIDIDGEDAEYTIDLSEGDGVIITASAPSNSFLDTMLILENEDGDVVARNDDYDYPTTTDSQIDYVAEDDGRYTIILGNYSGTYGDYVLTIEYVEADEIADGNGDSPDLIVQDYQDDDNPDDEYPIELEAGDAIVINATADEDSELDTILTLLDGNGDQVAFNDDIVFGKILDSQIVFIVEDDGEYTILVSNFPDTEGDYTLTVTFVSEEEAQAIIDSEAGVPTIDDDDIIDNNDDFDSDDDTTPNRDPDESYTGEVERDLDEIEYTLDLEAGDGIIAALYATNDDGYDATLFALDPDGNEIAYNDDRADLEGFDSQLTFTATVDGEYTVIVTNYPGFPGDYRLDIYYATPEEVLRAEQAMRVFLSGPEELIETEHFLIHFTQEGFDAADLDYVEAIAEAMEEIYVIQIEELGWALPPSDNGQGGDSRIDVYVRDITFAYGYADSTAFIGDNPNTELVEENSHAGFLVLDNDYDLEDDPIYAMRSVAAHEFHHIIQFGYDLGDWSWYYEATATWLETTTFPENDLAIFTVESVYTYPEACFGGDGFADLSGLGVYGSWLFIDFMAQSFGEDAPLLLWENVALEDEWNPLISTLAEYDETIPSFLPQYHINNLVRDYALADLFDEYTVWLENTITDIGEWEPDGSGVQELGANYLQFDMDEGIYRIVVDDNDLELFVIGITDDIGEVYEIGTAGTIDTSDYDYVYIMVFNPVYDDDIFQCHYDNYDITVSKGLEDDVAQVSYEIDATHFRELGN